MSFVYEPINISKPPSHTKIEPRCFQCVLFPACNIRHDYLQTAKLIENILGNPQEDYELREEDGGFYGFDFENKEDYFPSEIQFDDETKGTLLSAKYVNKNFVRVLYEINKFYYQFIFFWLETNRYEVSKGRELYYGLEIKMPTEVANTISTSLLTWREEMERKEEEDKEKEVINTTFFSAILNCQFYRQDKNLTPQEKINRMALHCDNPCDCHYHHLATYHIENEKVPELSSTFSPVPVLYPVFIPKDKKKKCDCKKGVRRDDFCTEDF